MIWSEITELNPLGRSKKYLFTVKTLKWKFGFWGTKVKVRTFLIKFFDVSGGLNNFHNFHLLFWWCFWSAITFKLFRTRIIYKVQIDYRPILTLFPKVVHTTDQKQFYRPSSSLHNSEMKDITTICKQSKTTSKPPHNIMFAHDTWHVPN